MDASMDMTRDMTPGALYGIHCDVTNCYYNEQKGCVADNITVGPQYAASSADTICSTFKPR